MVPQHTDREAPRLPPPPGQRGDKAPDNAKHQVPTNSPNHREIVINNPTQYSIFLRKVTPQSQLNISEEDGKDNLFLIQFFQGASFTFLCPMRYFFPIDFFLPNLCEKTCKFKVRLVPPGLSRGPPLLPLQPDGRPPAPDHLLPLLPEQGISERHVGVLGVNVGAEDEGGDRRGGTRPQRRREPQHVHHQDIPIQVQEEKISFPTKKGTSCILSIFSLAGTRPSTSSTTTSRRASSSSCRGRPSSSLRTSSPGGCRSSSPSSSA